MPARYVRVIAVSTIDNPDTAPLHIDVGLTAEGMIVGDRAIFGFQGDIKNRYGRSLPFILYSDGKADFGEKYPDGDRFGELNLREDRVYLRRLLRFSGNGFDEIFRIVDIVDIEG
jgi:hypothetical protein